MSLRGYKPKWKKALWTKAFESKYGKPFKVAKVPLPKRVRAESKRRRPVNAAYRDRAREFVREAARHWPLCPVVAYARWVWNTPYLSSANTKVSALEESMRWLAGYKYGHPVSARLNEVHHVYGRAGRLLQDERWWMAVSKQGHRWIHENEDFARALGWLCPKGHWNTHPDELRKKGVDCLPPFGHNGGVSNTAKAKSSPKRPRLRPPPSCSQPAESGPVTGASEPIRKP